MIHIGKKIKEIQKERGISAADLAKAVPCDRSNIYHVFRRTDISVQLLVRLSAILDYDFLRDLSEDLRKEWEEQEDGEQ